MYFEPQTTVAFTGHRTYHGEAAEALAATLRRLYDQGCRIFLNGMAVGFDLAAAEAVLVLRRERPAVQLVCIVPFEGQESRYSPTDRERYRAVLSTADGVEYVCEGYRAECYALRNDRLVSGASILVAWYDGSPGGTRYTVRKAQKAGVRIIHLKKQSEPELF